MKFVGKTVPNGNARKVCKLLDDLLPEAAVFDAVIHSAKHTRGIGDAFLFADLRAGGIEIGHAHTKIACGDLKRTTRAGAGLFKNERNILALVQFVRNARLLFGFEIGGKVDQPLNFCGGKIQ